MEKEIGDYGKFRFENSKIKCPNCGYVGKSRNRFSHWFVILGFVIAGWFAWGFVKAVWRLTDIFPVETLTGPAYEWIGVQALIFLAIFVGLIIYGMKNFCPKCGSKSIVKQ